MDNSFYGLDGYEPWRIAKTAEDCVEMVLHAHLCYVGGELKPAEDIKKYITIRRVDGAVIYTNSCHSERNLMEDIVYNLKKFLKEAGI